MSKEHEFAFASTSGGDIYVTVTGENIDGTKDLDVTIGETGKTKEFDGIDGGGAGEVFDWLIENGVEFDSDKELYLYEHYVSSVMLDGDETAHGLLVKIRELGSEGLADWRRYFHPDAVTMQSVKEREEERKPQGLRALIIPVDGLPRETRIPVNQIGSALKGLQEAVGGYIEPFNVLFDPRAVSLYINDDSLATCPANRAIYATEHMEKVGYISQMDYRTPVKEGDLYAILHGDIVAVGYNPETGDSRSLTDGEVSEVTEYFTEVSEPGSGQEERDAIAALNSIMREALIVMPDERMSLEELIAAAAENERREEEYARRDNARRADEGR